LLFFVPLKGNIKLAPTNQAPIKVQNKLHRQIGEGTG